jgi:hypothetical protein
MVGGIAADGGEAGLLAPVFDPLVPGIEAGSLELGFDVFGVCSAGLSEGVFALGVVGAADPAVTPVWGPGLATSSEPQPIPVSTTRVNEQDASVRAYVLVMTVPNATG